MRRFIGILSVLLLIWLVPSVRGEWVKQKTGSLGWFRTIHFVNSEVGRIGGSRGTYLETTDGGKTWRPGVKFTSDSIRKLYFSDVNRGWALCERDIYNLRSNDPTYLMYTVDGGKSWEHAEIMDSNHRRLTTIAFSSSGFGIALGEMGSLYGLADGNYSWKKMAPPTVYLILDGAFANDQKGAIVGGGGTIMYTEDAGASWTPAVVSGTTRNRLNSVFFVNEYHGWTAGSGGLIYQTINGGKYWRRQKSGTNANLTDVHFTDNAHGWAIGEQGTILRTLTGGNLWREMNSNSRNNLEDMQFVGEIGWIVGFGGTLLKYDANENTTARPKLQK